QTASGNFSPGSGGISVTGLVPGNTRGMPTANCASRTPHGNFRKACRRQSGSRTLLYWLSFRFRAVLMRQVPGNQAIQFVTVGSVGAKSVFIEQTLDAATQADLVGVLLQAYWPAHSAMPAAGKNHQSSACHPG